jgi:iron complex transport system substrate-binding protein
MSIKDLIIILVASFSILSCNYAGKKKSELESTRRTEIRHARGFTIHYFGNYTEVTVRNPWDTTRVLENYILVDRKIKLPDHLPEGIIVRTPITKVAVCTGVYAGIWKSLGRMNSIVAVCEPQYIELPEVKRGVADGKIIDLGLATAIDLEKLIAVSPDILIISPFENTTYGRLEKTGIPVVEDASYMEDSPLGRAEWIKFEAVFAGEDELAEEIFSKIETKYRSLCAMVAKTKERPTVFAEKKYSQVWYVPGGNSYVGRFFNDAGANYLWRNLPQSGSVPLSFETVFDKAEKAQFWLIKYNNANADLTYSDLKSEYELYANFDAFKQKRIFGLNSGKTSYYEVGPMEPDVILADLVHVFHPELLPNYVPKYYFSLK